MASDPIYNTQNYRKLTFPPVSTALHVKERKKLPVARMRVFEGDAFQCILHVQESLPQLNKSRILS